MVEYDTEKFFLRCNMKTVGIIAEYNPFHKGHEYQIQYAKEKLHADYTIVAMSGDFVQRGTPALFPKHLRTEMALRCGADLVLELPVSVSTASAEFFAQGGVQLLDSLGVVDMLCFGSEAGKISGLMELAHLLTKEPPAYQILLKEFLSKGMSFPTARSSAILEYFKNPEIFPGDDFGGVLLPPSHEISKILSEPNNILGIEYCKALIRLNSSMKPVTIQREGHGYHDTELSPGHFASATAIRKMAADINAGSKADSENTEELITKAAEYLPINIGDLFSNALETKEFLTESDLDVLLHYALLRENSESISQYLDLSPELSQRILNCRNSYQGFSQFVSLLKTRELTYTRIQRGLLHLLLGIRTAPGFLPYARVLGFRRESSPLLKAIKQNCRIPLITKLADASSLLDESGLKLLEETVFASNLYEALLSHKTGRSFLHEYQKQLVIL